VTQRASAPPTTANLAILMPGTGSDDVFVRSVFEVPLAAVGVRALTPRPCPGPALAESYLRALDEAAAAEPVLAGGVSFGAHLAAEWALRNPGRCAGLLLALPAWSGDPGDAPAAVTARVAATAVRTTGLGATLRGVHETADAWLAAELDRAWHGYGAGLADSLLSAAGRPAPTLAELKELRIPAGVAACVDDPIHPLAVARSWTAALPQARLCTTRLDIIGADPEALGRAAVLAWLRAGGRP
jgi:pimeloyl-ACP methyl ester carboxylesterase